MVNVYHALSKGAWWEASLGRCLVRPARASRRARWDSYPALRRSNTQAGAPPLWAPQFMFESEAGHAHPVTVVTFELLRLECEGCLERAPPLHGPQIMLRIRAGRQTPVSVVTSGLLKPEHGGTSRAGASSLKDARGRLGRRALSGASRRRARRPTSPSRQAATPGAGHAPPRC